MENSAIEWTDHTFNPWVGCTKISPACDHCYAEAWAKRTGQAGLWGYEPRRRTTEANWRQPLRWNRRAAEFGVRHRVFCASLADVFDNAVPQQWRHDLFELIDATPNLDWLLLTKRIGNAVDMGMPVVPRPNVWLGATVVNQHEANRDVPKLLQVPARVRFLSIEPMLGPIELEWNNWLEYPHGVDWVIVGGESGPQARPINPGWVRLLRDDCELARVPFFFKQWGEWGPDEGPGADGDDPIMRGKGPVAWWTGHLWRFAENGYTAPLNECEWVYRLGKKRTGRELDGRVHSAFPL